MYYVFILLQGFLDLYHGARTISATCVMIEENVDMSDFTFSFLLVEITQRFLSESSKEDKDEVVQLCLSALAEKCQAIGESIEKANETVS